MLVVSWHRMIPYPVSRGAPLKPIRMMESTEEGLCNHTTIRWQLAPVLAVGTKHSDWRLRRDTRSQCHRGSALVVVFDPCLQEEARRVGSPSRFNLTFFIQGQLFAQKEIFSGESRGCAHHRCSQFVKLRVGCNAPRNSSPGTHQMPSISKRSSPRYRNTGSHSG